MSIFRYLIKVPPSFFKCPNADEKVFNLDGSSEFFFIASWFAGRSFAYDDNNALIIIILPMYIKVIGTLSTLELVQSHMKYNIPKLNTI